MRFRFKHRGTVFVAAIFIFLVTLCLFVGVFQWSGRTSVQVKLDCEYHFLVRDCSTATAGAVAGDSYLAGGAGYLLDGEDAVVLACYYNFADASFIEGTMSERGIETHVLSRRFEVFTLRGEQTRERARIEANAKTLDSLSRILFRAANGLERTEITQEEARAALEGVTASLAGLAAENQGDCYALWNTELLRASRRGKELASGLLFAKDLRYLQVSLCVSVLQLADYFA